MGASTSIAVSGKVTIQGKPVVLNAGNVPKPGSAPSGLVFKLTDPATLGTAAAFVDWLNKTFNAGVDLPGIKKTLPPPLDSAFQSFIDGSVTLDSMTIDQPRSLYQLAVSYDLGGNGVSLLPGLAFNGIGVMVTHQIASTLAVGIDDLTKTTVTVAAGDGPQFTPPQGQTLTIVIDSETMTVSSVSGDTLTVTRGTPPATHTQGTAVRLGS